MTDSFQARFHVVIPCAGSGSRAGVATPKQYVPLAGVPMVVHTMKAFSGLPHMGQGVLVVSPDDSEIDDVFEQNPQQHFVISRTGGATRAQSVLAGLRYLQSQGVTDNEWVMVHDAARCLITTALIETLWRACQADAVGGLLALPVPDTLKVAGQDRVESTLSRSGKWLAQTPQMFKLAELVQALLQVGDQVTDESGAIEAMGLQPLLVAAAAFNFKVTYAEDLPLAQAMLISRQAIEKTSLKDKP